MEQPVLLKSVKVHDPQGPWHGKVVDVLMKQGRIDSIATSLSNADAFQAEASGSMVSPGWVDAQAHFREPGDETKEGMEHGLLAATQGGYTAVAVLPSTTPRVDHASAVRNVQSLARQAHSKGIPAEALPMACLSEHGKGEQLSEMHDMSEAGALVFSDDTPIDRVSLLQRALTYSNVHGKAIVDLPLDRDMNPGGLMHEGVTSTEMGLTGIPSEAETMRVQRDIDLLKYAGGHLHLAVVTTAQSLVLIQEAKRSGLNVTCGTTAAHLLFCDEDLAGFAGSLRVPSPFRSKEDRTALRQGVLDGTIDVVVSDHRPEDLEHHDVEFMLSPEGMASLPSSFAMALSGLMETAQPEEALNSLLRALTNGARNLLTLPLKHIDIGSDCDITWFHPNAAHVPHIGTRGVNLPPFREGLKGHVLGVFKDDRAWLASAQA